MDTLLSLLMRQATIRAIDLSYFSSYQTLSADKNWKSYYRTKLKKSGHIWVNRGKAVNSLTHKGSGGNKKLPARRFPTVGIV